MNGSKSHGPNTHEGLTRSSLNAMRTGIRAKKGLLATEDESEFLAELDLKMTALCPNNAAEAEVVWELTYLEFRFARLAAAEKKHFEAFVAEELAKTDASKRLRHLDATLMALRALVVTVEQSRPTSAAALAAFVPALSKTVDLVRAVEAQSTRLVSGLPQLLHAMYCLTEWEGPEWPVELFGSLVPLATPVIVDLESRREYEAAEVAELQHDLLVGTAPPNNAVTKRLMSYRRELEREQLHQLQVLEQLRRLPGPAGSGSFERPLMRVNLRGAPAKA